MRLSIVIPTMGRPTLLKTIDSLDTAEGAEEVELLVVGNIESEPVRVTLQEKLSSFRGTARWLPISFDRGDSSRKKNAGAEQARGLLIAFLDDDVVVSGHWIGDVLAAFEDPAVGLASGPSLIPDDINIAGRLSGLALAARAAGYVAARYRGNDGEAYRIRWSGIIGCNMCYRREAFNDSGRFPPDFWPGEEMIAAFRTEQARWRAVFIPRAWVYHYPRSSFRGFGRQVYGYGATRIRLMRAGVAIEWTTLVPAFWVLSLAALIPASFFSAWARWLLFLDLAAYALLATACAVETVCRTGRRSDFSVALMIPVMHLAYGLGQWAEFFRPDRDLGEQYRRSSGTITKKTDECRSGQAEEHK